MQVNSSNLHWHCNIILYMLIIFHSIVSICYLQRVVGSCMNMGWLFRLESITSGSLQLVTWIDYTLMRHVYLTHLWYWGRTVRSSGDGHMKKYTQAKQKRLTMTVENIKPWKWKKFILNQLTWQRQDMNWYNMQQWSPKRQLP